MDDTSTRVGGFHLFDLKEEALPSRPTRAKALDEQLAAIANAQHNVPVQFADAAGLELSARIPYTQAGRMDFYRPGRWDCESDLVFMAAIITGPSPGMWDGTVGYIRYVTPTSGSHLVAVHFSGYQTTMEVRGPWGLATGYTPTTSDHFTVTALWQANAGDVLNFTIQCKGDGIGYLESIQVRQLT